MLAGWVVDRGDWFWLVLGSVVVAVDIGTCDLLDGWMEGPAVQTRSSAGLKSPLTGDRFAGL